MGTAYKKTHTQRASLSIPEALGKLSIGGPLPTYVVEDQKKGHHHLK